MKKISMAVLTLIIAGLFYMFLPLDSELLSQNAWERKLAEHNFPDIIEQEDEGRFLSYSEFREEVSGDPEDLYDAYKDRYIRFDTAEELYRFSVDVCYHPDVVYQIGEEKLSEEMIGVLLKLNYVLGCDIDYAVMKSRPSFRLAIPSSWKKKSTGMSFRAVLTAVALKFTISMSRITPICMWRGRRGAHRHHRLLCDVHLQCRHHKKPRLDQPHI